MKLFHALVICLFASAAWADLVIYHLDVGMGDATLIANTVSEKTLLVDAGNRNDGKTVVAEAIKTLGYSRIDYFVATHYDAAHIGGFDEIVEVGIPFSVVYDRGGSTDRPTVAASGRATQYGAYIGMAGAARRTIDLRVDRCADRDEPIIDIGHDTIVDVVAVGGAYIDKNCLTDRKDIDPLDDNARSIALVIRHGQFSYFIGGDLTGGGNDTIDMESAIAATVGDIDVLRINHHGSNTSTNSKFLNILRPEAVIFSVGNKGENLLFGLPKQAVLDRVKALDTKPVVFLTNRGEGGKLDDARVENGHVIIHTNGRSYSINNLIFTVDEALDS